jgi:hypothetical protein
MPFLSRTVVLDPAGLNVLQWPLSQAGELINYFFDISAAINTSAGTVTSIGVSVQPSGTGELQIRSVTYSGGLISVFVSDGIAGRVYKIRADVILSSGAVFSWVLTLPMGVDAVINNPPVPPNPGFGAVVYWPPVFDGG